MIFTGDFFQLPPVVQSSTSSIREYDKENNFGSANAICPHGYQKQGPSEIERRKYCFESSVWNELFPDRSQSCFLKQIYRQQDESFISLLDSIRWGNPIESVMTEINKSIGNIIDCSDGILPTQICTHR